MQAQTDICTRPGLEGSSLPATFVASSSAAPCSRRCAILVLRKHAGPRPRKTAGDGDVCVSLQRTGESWELEMARRFKDAGCCEIPSKLDRGLTGKHTAWSTCEGHLATAYQGQQAMFAREVEIEGVLGVGEAQEQKQRLHGRADFLLLLHHPAVHPGAASAASTSSDAKQHRPVLVIVECKASPMAQRKHMLQVKNTWKGWGRRSGG